MKTTTITLLGKEYKLALNFAAMLAFEDITKGKDVFDSKAFEAGKVKFLLSLFYSMLLANNDENEVPEFDTIRAIDDMQVMSEIITTTAAIHREMLLVSANDPAGKKKEDEPKNA